MTGYRSLLLSDETEDFLESNDEDYGDNEDPVDGSLYNPFLAPTTRHGEELEGEMVSLVQQTESGSDDMEAGSTNINSPPRNRLGIVMGVYIPCLLSIFGVIMFERMGWVLGEAGLLTAYLILFTGFCMVFLTALSISAIATNGKMKGGGAYFMVSRSLGPEFGGAIGLIFYSANVSGAALYLVGLVEGIHNTFPSIPSSYWWNVLYSSIGLLLLTIVCLLGASAFVKANFIIFGVMTVAMVACLGSLLFEKENLTEGFTRPSKETFKKNLYPQFTPTKDPYSGEEIHQDFQTIFAIFFPAVTGIMAGANMSGDLEDPAKSIPKGTMAAIFTTVAYYFFLLLALAFSVQREALLNNNYILMTVCFWSPLVILGIIASTLSNALGGLIGASRVFQALAKDNLLPFIGFFAKGTRRRNEPRRAVGLTWILAQGVLLVGNVDRLAMIATMFFLLSYAITNFACFALIVSGTPNYRPTFHYNTWYLSLLGTILCFGGMFYVSPFYASLSVLIMLVLFFYINYRSPEADWGHVSQAIIYHQVRKFLLRLDMTKEHVKHWRPQILFLVSNPNHHYKLVDFTNNLKKGGLYILAHVVVGDPSSVGARCARFQRSLCNYIKKAKLKAFPEVSLSPSFRIGVQHMVMASGLGIMRPNTIVIGFPSSLIDNPQAPEEEIHKVFSDSVGKDPLQLEEYVDVIRDVITLQRNIIIARNFEKLSSEYVVGFGRSRANSLFRSQKFTSIDIWVLGTIEDIKDEQSVGVMMLMSWILSRTEMWKDCSTLRVLGVVHRKDEQPEEEARLEHLITTARIEAKIRVLVLSECNLPHYESLVKNGVVVSGSSKMELLDILSSRDRCLIYNEVMNSRSSDAGVLFASLPLPPDDSAAPQRHHHHHQPTRTEGGLNKHFIEDLNLLTKDLPPILLTRGSMNVITTDL